MIRPARSLPWNLLARPVSGSVVLRPPVASALAFALSLGVLLGGAPHASAQRAQPETGYELALSGTAAVRGDREAHLRGVAYRVRGLATLETYAGPVRGRFRTETTHGAWQDVTSGADGRFELVVPIGPRPTEEHTEPRIEVQVGPERGGRTFSFPVQVAPPWELDLFTDRNLYEPGEPVHVWLLVRDAASGRPAVDRQVVFELSGATTDRRPQHLTTSAAGVAHLSFDLPESAPSGSIYVSARVDGAQRSTSVNVGRRTWERLFAHVEIQPEEVAPGAAATAVVRVTSADATPIRDATVDVFVGEMGAVRGVTSATGEARIEVRAPAYLSGETGFASVRVHVEHSAYGSVEAQRSMRLAVPLSLSLEIIPAHGALIPEVDDVVFVQLSDALSEPPPAGTTVELVGPAIPSGRAQGVTDANGLVAFAVRLPRGASAGSADDLHTTIRAHVTGTPLELTSRVSVRVHLEPEVVPTLAHPVAEPGARIEVRIARRPSAQRSPVIVELLSLGASELLDVVLAPPGSASVHVTVPPDRLGRLYVRARAVHANESLEGVGASDTLLVRPPAPDFVTITAVRERWRVGETARVELHSRPGGPRAWGAVLVRDLAAHGGESDFSTYFLDRAFEEALLEPQGETGERLLRAVLAAAAPIDLAPPIAAPVVDSLGLPDESGMGYAESAERGVLRDPWPLARELERRGLGLAMAQLESALSAALDLGSLDELTVGRGAARRFRDDVLDADEHRTLGEGALTPAMLEAADPSFSYANVGRRVARVRLIRLLSALASYLDPGDYASVAARTAAREPSARWLPRMVERGLITEELLVDPWGGRFALHTSAHPSVVLSTHATTLELVSPGPDGRLGTGDDVRDPFARAIPAATPYAVSSGEDALMRQLAILSPVERTLDALRAAYGRISAEMTEDEIGDAVHASVSEGTIGLGNIGTIGHGSGGGGTGEGYGSGSGGFRGRSSAVPTIRIGGANLARVVRERFPPTILFTPTFEVDASGTTSLDIPLADAVTSYRIEVIVWREDGWIWSARTEISSDRDIVIDAPIPTTAHLGDRLSIPLRVQNHGDTDREILVSLLGDRAIGIDDVAPRRVTVPAGSATAVVVTLAPGARGEGSLRVVASDLSGVALDAVRRPLSVVLPYRRVRATAEVLVDGHGELALAIDETADPISATASVVVGSGLFDSPGDSAWSAWSSPGDLGVEATERGLVQSDASILGFTLGAAYSRAGIEDERLRHAEERLSQILDASHSAGALEERAWTLLGLAPAAPILSARPDLREDTGLLIARLVREVGDGSAGVEENPAVVALAAAALGWSGDERSRPRVAELVRRVSTSVVEVGDDVWLATETTPIRSTLLLAIAELALDHRPRAFALLATVARFRALGHALAVEETGLARAIANRLAAGTPPTVVRLLFDGTTTEVRLAESSGWVDLPALAGPGAHRLAIEADGSAPVRVAVAALYGVGWDRAPERAGPFTMTLSGETGALDDVSQLELRVVNRSPRWITAPVVELELPTGAELAEQQHELIRRVVRSSLLAGTTLTISLRALAPGAEVVVPLPVRWSVAGTLAGIGASAHATDAPDAVSILRPEPLVIEGAAP